jgi:hypothetical protein
MKFLIFFTSALLLSTPGYARILELYETKLGLTEDDLIVQVNGYKVPTRDAFEGWLLVNQAHHKVRKIGQYFIDNGVQGKLPLYLVLLQGTDWQLNEKSVFVLPSRDHIDNMVRTVKYVEQHIVPVIGDLVPVSGERSEEYNATSGGASRSKHLNFCAMDMVPEQSWDRAELHQKLIEIHNRSGQANNVGLGLYSGLRFHIDTCGFRRW